MGALSGGSWVWFLPVGTCWKPGQKGFGLPGGGGHCALPRLLQSFTLQARARLYEQEPLCSAVPADKAHNAVPASGACSRPCEIQWGYCQKCHGIMCEWLSPQRVHGGAGGQLGCADLLRETRSVSPFLNVSLNVLSWHHFPIWELGGLPARCCLVAVKGLSPTVTCHQLADGHGSHKCLQYVLLTEATPMCQSRAG